MGLGGRKEGVTGQEGSAATGEPRLLDQVRARLRVRHYSLRTEQAYVGWIRRFILANGKRHPRELEGRHVEAFLTGLATRGRVAASTQNQALAALLFLYRDVLQVELPGWIRWFGPSGRDGCRWCCRRRKCGACCRRWMSVPG